MVFTVTSSTQQLIVFHYSSFCIALFTVDVFWLFLVFILAPLLVQTLHKAACGSLHGTIHPQLGAHRLRPVAPDWVVVILKDKSWEKNAYI